MNALKQKGKVKVNLANPLSQGGVMERLKFRQADVLIIDNLNTLYRTDVKSNDAEYMSGLTDFLLKLRAENIVVIIIDHEGKGFAGSPRGTSAKTDIMDVAITLERPAAACGARARFKVSFTKNRDFYGEDVEPFMAELSDGEWIVSGIPETPGSENGSKQKLSPQERKAEVYRMFDGGACVQKVVRELKIPQSTAYIYWNEWKALPKTHAESDVSAE